MYVVYVKVYIHALFNKFKKYIFFCYNSDRMMYLQLIISNIFTFFLFLKNKKYK